MTACGQCATATGNWSTARRATSPPELFNLANDVSEKDNLASAQPEKVKELKALWDAWNAQQAPPDAAKDKSLKREKRKGRKKE